MLIEIYQKLRCQGSSHFTKSATSRSLKADFKAFKERQVYADNHFHLKSLMIGY